MRQLWCLCFHLWEHRNTTKHHGATKRDIMTLKTSRLQVNEQFTIGKKGLGSEDHHLLDCKRTILSYNLNETQSWLSRILNARASQIRAAERLAHSLRKSRQLMHKWRATANPAQQ